MNLRSKVESLLTEALDQHPALFLIEHANYITGQIIAVDGGRTLSN